MIKQFKYKIQITGMFNNTNLEFIDNFNLIVKF